MSEVKGLCRATYKSGRPCVVRPRDGGDLCSYHRTLARPRYPVSVAAARDEVVRSAQAHYDGCSFHHQCVVCSAVAAVARLEGK